MLCPQFQSETRPEYRRGVGVASFAPIRTGKFVSPLAENRVHGGRQAPEGVRPTMDDIRVSSRLETWVFVQAVGIKAVLSSISSMDLRNTDWHLFA